MVVQRAWGFVALALLLIAVGMVLVLALTFQGRDVILGIVSILAGVLILIGK